MTEQMIKYGDIIAQHSDKIRLIVTHDVGIDEWNYIYDLTRTLYPIVEGKKRILKYKTINVVHEQQRKQCIKNLLDGDNGLKYYLISQHLKFWILETARPS